MGEGKHTQMCQDQWFQYGSNMKNNQDQHHELWMIKEGHEDHGEIYDNSHSSSSSVSSSIGESTISNGSCSSSLDTTDDASSSPSSCSPNSDGALHDLSDLMAQLPIKRGLSKFYQGKSQSFTSLSRVTSLEDLVKKETVPYNRRMKACKSYGAGLDSYKSYTLPKPTILKKSSRNSFSTSCTTGKASFINKSRPPLIPVQRT